jgi:hypothetical protein
VKRKNPFFFQLENAAWKNVGKFTSSHTHRDHNFRWSFRNPLTHTPGYPPPLKNRAGAHTREPLGYPRPGVDTAKTGELSRDLEKHERARTDLHDIDVEQTKTETLEQAGINVRTAERYEELAPSSHTPG